MTPQLGQGSSTSTPAPGGLGFDPNAHSNETLDIMWGKKFGTTSLGLRLNRSFASAEGDLAAFDAAFGPVTTLKYDVIFDPPPAPSAAYANLHRNILGFGGGVGFEINPNTNAEFSLLWQKRTFEVTSPAAKDENDGSATYVLAGRAFWQWQPNVMVVPVLKWYSYDLSTKTSAGGGASFDNSLKGWQAGVAGNWTLGQNDLFVLGMTFAENKVEEEAPVLGPPVGFADFDIASGKITETIAPQLFAALETHVNSWLTLRFGATKGAYTKLKFEDDVAGTTAKVTYAPFHMSLGTGVKLGALQLDAVLNDSFPQTLGGMFSNTADYVAFNRVTATYSF